LKEIETQKQVLDYLKFMKVFHWRNNAIPVKGRTFKGMCGTPDIICILPGGQFFGIEVKTDVGILSHDQKEFREKCELLGAQYLVVRELGELASFLKSIGYC
jgi:hypothetical protein